MAFALTHNGGRSQVNLNSLQAGGDFPFLNHLKNCQGWALADNSNWPDPDTLDDDGYPISISHGGVYTVFFIPSQRERPGNYVVEWDGNGTVLFNFDCTLVSGSLSSTTGSGRCVIAPHHTRVVFGISETLSPRVTNIRFYHEDDEQFLNNGEVFSHKFKQRLREAKFGVIRFLNWQVGNTTNVTTWATRKPESYAWWAGAQPNKGLYAGVTSITRPNTYQVAAPPNWGGLVDKATVIVKFGQDATSACTLNVGNTGAKNILNQSCGPLDEINYPKSGSSNCWSTLIFDASLDAWIKQGGDLALGGMNISNGIPPELAVRLCAEVGAHPHFVCPPLAMDPATDWAPSLAAYCRDNAPGWMIPFFEGPNELWNYAWGFFQTSFADAKAKSYGWGDNQHHEWYGKVMSVLGQAVSNVYGGNRSRYKVICGVQTGGDTSASAPRLSSAKYVAQEGPAQEGYTKTPAKDWVTSICIANYYTPSAREGAAEEVLAAAYGGCVFTGLIIGNHLEIISDVGGHPVAIGMTIEGLGIEGGTVLPNTVVTGGAGPSWTLSNNHTESLPPINLMGYMDKTQAEKYAETATDNHGPFTLVQLPARGAIWKAWAKSFGIYHMVGYEGGYSPDFTGGGLSSVDLLRAGSKRLPAVGKFTLINYHNFIDLSDDDDPEHRFVSEYPSCFQFTGSLDADAIGRVNNTWSVLDNIYQTPNPAQWDAICLFNAGSSRITLRS